MLALTEWTQDVVRHALRESVCRVTFTKVNGEQRVMKCTLNESLIPPSDSTKITESRKKETETVQPVYDVEANGWRSFRWESVTSFELVAS